MVRGAAIVIGGAVAKGAFAAGALAELTQELAEERVPVRTVVGTSSGALNATMIAAGVRVGDAAEAARRLVELWELRADVWHVFEPDLGSWWHRRGLSGTQRIVELLARECPVRKPLSPAEHVALRIVVAPLAGSGAPTNSFEHVERFVDADLDAEETRLRVFHAAAASAAFPFAFQPVTLEDVGPSVDGGVVNNTPIGEAIGSDPDVEDVYVIAADPADMALTTGAAEALGGSELLLRLVEMLIDERLTRDLAEARAVNGWIDVLDGMQSAGTLSTTAREEVIRGLYPDRDPRTFRHLNLIEIRPATPLQGNPFKGFFKSDLRHDYIEQGRVAAKAIFGEAAEAAVVGAKAAVLDGNLGGARPIGSWARGATRVYESVETRSARDECRARSSEVKSMATASPQLSLYYWPTPNGHKVTLFLEETGLPYEIHPINIGKGEQFHPDFLRISPNNKMPALVDPAPADGSGPLAIFESGAILLYLAEKTGRFLPADLHGRMQVIQWLFWQMSGVGPTLGQNHHFNQYAPEKIPYAIERFVKESTRLYAVLDERLRGREFIAGEYSIADMACYPWMSNHDRQQIDVEEFQEVKRWLAAVRERPATRRAYARGKDFATGPVVTEEARRFLFGQDASTVRGH